MKQALFKLFLLLISLSPSLLFKESTAVASPDADDSLMGKPILPGEALAPIQSRAETPEALRQELHRVGAIQWQKEEAGVAEGRSIEANIFGINQEDLDRTFVAYVVGRPTTMPLHATETPQSCYKVRDAFYRVKQKIAELDLLRRYVERDLVNYENLLRHRRTAMAQRTALSIDAKLDQINDCLSFLSEFAEAEAKAVADRKLVYTFQIYGRRAAALRRAGFRPKGAVQLSRARFHKSDWSIVDNSTIANFEGIEAPPQAAENTNWQMTRVLTPSQACRQTLHFELEGTANAELSPNRDTVPELILIRVLLVSREAPWFVWD